MAAIGKIISPIKNGIKTIYNRIPQVTVTRKGINNAVEHIGRKWTSPQQRLIMGATAVMLQLPIDARNSNIDADTKKAAVAKNLAKIIVGTATGVAIRHFTIKAIKAFSVPFDALPKNITPISRKIKTFFTPENITSKMTDELSQYRNSMGTIISLLIMLFTNFAIDAPWTNKLTNFFMKNPKFSVSIDKFIQKRTPKTEGAGK